MPRGPGRKPMVFYYALRDPSARLGASTPAQDGPTPNVTDRLAQAIAKGLIGLDEPARRRTVGRSLGSIETALERLELSWAAGRLSEATYAIERATYEELRREITEAPAPATPLPNYDRLLADWRSAEPSLQRRTLCRLFEVLYVEDGEIKRYRPRREHRVAVVGLIDKASCGGFEWAAPRSGRGANLTKQARYERRASQPLVAELRGKGGIPSRTSIPEGYRLILD
jgi:hypothetical protein